MLNSPIIKSEIMYILQSIFPRDICSHIVSLMYPINSGCLCRDSSHKVTCFLCQYACCRQASREFCVCFVRTVCNYHGTYCHGNHD